MTEREFDVVGRGILGGLAAALLLVAVAWSAAGAEDVTPQLVTTPLPVVLPVTPDTPRPDADRHRIPPAAAAQRPDQVRARQISERYGNLPLSFEANRGQAHPDVEFLARAQDAMVFLTATDVILAPGRRGADNAPARTAFRMRFVGGRPSPRIAGLDELPGRVNYFLGNDPGRWNRDVRTYGKVRYHDVYPGIDVVHYGHQRQLEHDFIVAPGADPARIRLAFPGADGLELSADGDLMIRLGPEVVRQRKPFVYQMVDGERREVTGRFVLHGGEATFQIASYDTTRVLVIDPVLSYSTYLGGSADDFGTGIVVDGGGNAYVTGWTSSANFPVTPGGFQAVRGTGLDAFVAKLNPQGTALLYSTFLGGNGNEFEVIGIAVDATGHAYVTGGTESSNFPTTPGALQTTLKGHVNAFVTKLDPTGSALVYSTYLGGSVVDGTQSIVVDAAGSAYVLGFTQSTDFPTTAGAFRTVSGGGQDVFVVKLNPAGSGLVYGTYLGGTGEEFAAGLAVDAAGNAYVTGYTQSTDFPATPGAFRTVSAGGQDAFVTKLNRAGSGLVYSTYLGGSSVDEGRDVALDPAGSAYVVGITQSVDFPITPGVFQPALHGANDVFVTKLNPEGSALVYSTYLGGGGPDISRRIALDALGNAYVTGATNSPDFPTTPGALQPLHAGGEDAFVTKLNADGSAILFSTFLGGGGNDRARGMAVDGAGNVFVIGFTSSTDFPRASPLQPAFAGGVGNCFFSGGCDAFIAKISRIPAVDLTLRSATTSVARGAGFPFTIEISNTTNQAQAAAFVLLLHVPNGQEFPLTPPTPIGLAPNATVTQNIVLGPLPSTAPSGSWSLRGLVMQPRPGAIDFIDQSVLLFTVQ